MSSKRNYAFGKRIHCLCVGKERFEKSVMLLPSKTLKINEYSINTINFIFQQMGFIRAVTLHVVVH